MGRQDAAPVVWCMALSWIVAVAAGTAFGAWRDDVVERQVKKSRATAAQPGA